MNKSSVVRKELHKAWRITVKGFSENFLGYGSTAGAVRYLVYKDLIEAWDTAKFSDIKVRRHDDDDVMRSLGPDEALEACYDAI